MPHYRLSFIGFGNVARSLARLLERKREVLEQIYDVTYSVTGIATGKHGFAVNPEGLDVEKALELVESGASISSLSSTPVEDSSAVIRSSQAEVMFENSPVNTRTGQPALDHIRLALSLGQHAITANKGPVVHGYRELTELARSKGKSFRFESTFMILGDTCTRACKFCAVKTGKPPAYDLDEPRRVAAAIAAMGIRPAVITSVDRDDLADGGASVFAETVRRTREARPGIRVEVLIPDFRGDREALRAVVACRPDILAHNIETVPRLYRSARAGSRYPRSLGLLGAAKALDADIVTKSSIMVGLGERRDEVLEALSDLRGQGVDIVTLGQYLQPTRQHLAVERFYSPGEFAELRHFALSLSFRHAEAGPLVRSSYHAEKQAAGINRGK